MQRQVWNKQRILPYHLENPACTYARRKGTNSSFLESLANCPKDLKEFEDSRQEEWMGLVTEESKSQVLEEGHYA